MAMSAIPDEEVEESPGLTEIPILPEDYPLFSWEDWPESRAALVSGTPTEYFSKETWNAIVDAINDALGIAGIDWYDPRRTDEWEPYTVDDSKILRPYGQLTAADFNTVCNNVDIGAPASWAWAMDENFPGYIGRKRFKGTTITYDEDGAITKMKYGDKVYASYILELVRRVNLMLGLMRGTVPTKDAAASINAGTSIYHKGARSLPGARIRREYTIHTNISLPSLDMWNAIVFEPYPSLICSTHAASMEKLNAAGITKYVNSKTLRSVTGRVNHARVYNLVTEILTKSNTQATIVLPEYLYLSAENISLATEKVIADQVLPLHTMAQVATSSRSSAVVESGLFRPVDVLQLSHSKHQLDVCGKRRVQTSCTPISRTAALVEIYQAVITRLRMHTEFSVGVIGRAFADAVRDVLLWDAFKFLLSGRLISVPPTSVLLHLYSGQIFTSNTVVTLPNNLWLLGTDGLINTANIRHMHPANVFLLDVNNTVRHANVALMGPTALLLFARNPSPGVAAGFLQNPTNVLLYLQDAAVNHAAVRLYGASNAYLFAYQLLLSVTNIVLETPRENRLLAWATNDGNAGADVEAPIVLLTLGLLKHLGLCNGKVDQPEHTLLRSIHHIFGHAGSNLDIPKDSLASLTAKEILNSHPHIDLPRDILHYTLEGLCGIYCCPQTDNPLDHLLLATIANRARRSQPRIDAPRSNWLHALIMERKMGGCPRLDAPRENLLLVPVPERKMCGYPELDDPRSNLLYVSIPERKMYGQPQADIPRDNLLIVPIPERMMWNRPKRDTPRDYFLRIFESEVYGQAQIDAPRENLLCIPIEDQIPYSYPRQESPCASLLYSVFFEWETHGCPMQEVPRGYFLHSAIDEMGISGYPQNDSPQQVYLINRNGIKTHTAETTETPTSAHLFANMLALVGYTDLRDGQHPSSYLLYAVNRTNSIVSGLLENPWLYRAYQISHSFGCAWPEMVNPNQTGMYATLKDREFLQPKKQHPTSCLQVLSESLLSVANAALILRRIAHGIFCSSVTGAAVADMVEPTRMRLYSENILIATAHAAVSIRRDINSSGIFWIGSLGSARYALHSPVDVQMQTAFLFACRSSSTSAAAISTIPTQGIVTLIPVPSLAQARSAATVAGSGGIEFFHELSAQGYVAGVHPAFGIVTIPNVIGYGTSRTATAVHSAGQPIHIQFAVSLGGISGRFANIRMHTVLPDVYSIAHSAKKATRPGRGIVAAHLAAETAHANAASTVHGRGCCGVEFGAVSGGYVRLAQAPWDNPVQTGSNLHITGAWNVQQVENSLYIE